MIQLATWAVVLIIFLLILVLSGIKIVYEYERGVKFTLGKYTGIMNPGLRIVIPVLQTWQRVDLRTDIIDVPKQDAITRDNVSVSVNAVLFYKVIKPDQAVLKIEDYYYGVEQVAQTTMRDVIGETTLDEILSSREKISLRIKQLVDKATVPWGMRIESVIIKDIILPGEMKRVMARTAEAERERRAVIINAEGEELASKNISTAANILGKEKGAMHLRTLHSLNDVSSDQTNTITFFVPLDVVSALEGEEWS